MNLHIIPYNNYYDTKPSYTLTAGQTYGSLTQIQFSIYNKHNDSDTSVWKNLPNSTKIIYDKYSMMQYADIDGFVSTNSSNIFSDGSIPTDNPKLFINPMPKNLDDKSVIVVIGNNMYSVLPQVVTTPGPYVCNFGNVLTINAHFKEDFTPSIDSSKFSEYVSIGICSLSGEPEGTFIKLPLYLEITQKLDTLALNKLFVGQVPVMEYINIAGTQSSALGTPQLDLTSVEYTTYLYANVRNTDKNRYLIVKYGNTLDSFVGNYKNYIMHNSKPWNNCNPPVQNNINYDPVKWKYSNVSTDTGLTVSIPPNKYMVFFKIMNIPVVIWNFSDPQP